MIMVLVIVQVIKVIHVIYVDLECFPHLKIVLNVDLRDPLRIQVIHYDFSHSDFLPLIANLFKQHTHTIGSCESIEVR